MQSLCKKRYGGATEKKKKVLLSACCESIQHTSLADFSLCKKKHCSQQKLFDNQPEITVSQSLATEDFFLK